MASTEFASERHSLEDDSSTFKLRNQTTSDEDLEDGIPGLFIIQSDGSVVRSHIFLPNVDARQAFLDPGVACKDVVVDTDKGLSARIFVPRRKSVMNGKKLPLTLFVHGGGFCMFSASTVVFHEFCKTLAEKANTVVLSFNYRLAPEHRLPTAYNDCYQFLEWLRLQAAQVDRSTIDSWLNIYADFSKCFLFGESAGANIVHHVALRAALTDLMPLHIKGIILSQPFFGSDARTTSEIETEHNESVIPVALCDEFWRFSLPLGANRDHPYSNPLSQELPPLSNIKLPRILLVVGGRDPLRDRQLAYFGYVQEAGKNIKLLYFEDAIHAFTFIPDQAVYTDLLLNYVVRFMHCHSKRKQVLDS